MRQSYPKYRMLPPDLTFRNFLELDPILVELCGNDAVGRGLIAKYDLCDHAFVEGLKLIRADEMMINRQARRSGDAMALVKDVGRTASAITPGFVKDTVSGGWRTLKCIWAWIKSAAGRTWIGMKPIVALVKAAVTGNFDKPDGMQIKNMDILQALLGAISIKDEIRKNPAVAAMVDEAGGIMPFMREFGSLDWKDPALVRMAEKYKVKLEQIHGDTQNNYRSRIDNLRAIAEMEPDKTWDALTFWSSNVGVFLKKLWELTHIWPILKAIPGQCKQFYEASMIAKESPKTGSKVLAYLSAFLEMSKFLATAGVMTGLAGKICAIFDHELGVKMLLGSYAAWGIVSLMAKHDHSDPQPESICDSLLGDKDKKEKSYSVEIEKKLAAKMIAIVAAGIGAIGHGVANFADPGTPMGLLDRQKAALEKKHAQSQAQTANESTLHDLYNSAVAAFPRTTKRQHAVDTIRITQLEWIPYLGVRTLYVRGFAQNVENGHEYRPIVLFKGVQYTDSSEPGSIPLIANDGKRYFLESLGLDKHEALVRCDCKDFSWRFNYYDHLDHSLYGQKRRRYEGTTGIQANPTESPGMCKHLMKMAMALQDSGILSEGRLAMNERVVNMRAMREQELTDRIWPLLQKMRFTDIAVAFIHDNPEMARFLARYMLREGFDQNVSDREMIQSFTDYANGFLWEVMLKAPTYRAMWPDYQRRWKEVEKLERLGGVMAWVKQYR